MRIWRYFELAAKLNLYTGASGDSHNFGRRVTRRATAGGGRIVKPRTVVWERLLLDAQSPLRRALDDIPASESTFAFLPDLKFFGGELLCGEVEALALEPLGKLAPGEMTELARIVGRSLALWSWLGVSDLHWENLALGKAKDGRIVFTPLDVEAIFDDLSLPTETKLLPDADPEVAEICRHACGVRRVLPYLGKPIDPTRLVEMAAKYVKTLDLLERHGKAISEAISQIPGLEETPIRVCLRGTDVYVHAMRGSQLPVWPPFLDAEQEQMARGDVPYFFRLLARPGIYYYVDPDLETVAQIPTDGDVPRLEPLLDLSNLSGSLRSPNRDILRTEGLFTILGAFDHPSFAGRHSSDELAIEFGDGVLGIETADEILETDRDLSAFVGSVYLPCRCGEVESALVPPTTACED